MNRKLQRKVVLIRGTSSGIGLSTALYLAKKGYSIVATMRDFTRSNQLRKSCARESLNIDIEHCDVRYESSMAQCVQEVFQKYGEIDVLVTVEGFSQRYNSKRQKASTYVLFSWNLADLIRNFLHME